LIGQPDEDQDSIEVDIDTQKIMITKNANASVNALYKCKSSMEELDNTNQLVV